MDPTLLVKNGHRLIELLTEANMEPQAVIWVELDETDNWHLWIVPPASLRDQREFYRRISAVVSKNRDSLGGLEASDAVMMAEDHPAIIGLSKIMRATGTSSIRLSHNMLNGYYLPDCIVLRLDITNNSAVAASS